MWKLLFFYARFASYGSGNNNKNKNIRIFLWHSRGQLSVIWSAGLKLFKNVFSVSYRKIFLVTFELSPLCKLRVVKRCRRASFDALLWRHSVLSLTLNSAAIQKCKRLSSDIQNYTACFRKQLFFWYFHKALCHSCKILLEFVNISVLVTFLRTWH